MPAAYLADLRFAVVLVDMSRSANVDDGVKLDLAFNTVMSDGLSRDNSGIIRRSAEGSTSCMSVSDALAS